MTTSSQESTTHKRPYALVMLVLILSLLLATSVGVYTSYCLAPGSLLALLVGFLWLLISYRLAYYAWMFADFLHNPRGNVRRSAKAFQQLGEELGKAMRQGEKGWSTSVDTDLNRDLPRGGLAFVVTFALCGIFTGIGVGLLLSEYPVVNVTVGYTLIGTSFGIVIYILVRCGLFPIADDLFDPDDNV